METFMQNTTTERIPLVSVIMSAYNEEKYILEAVESILNQSYGNLELIIIDDASKDGTVDKIRSIKDDRIRLYINSENKKLAHNLNFAIENANGKYIARMDADDIALPDRIAEQVAFMEKHSEIDVLGANAECFGNSSATMEYPESNEEIKVTLLFENAMCHPLVMFRKESFDEKYNESYSASQDYELWSRLIWEKQFCNIPSILLKYRIHNEQTRNKVGRQQKEGAIIARHQMLGHLITDPSPELTDTFDKMFSVGKVYEKKTIDQIEAALKKILEVNEIKRVFNQEALYTKCTEVYFENWYYYADNFFEKMKSIKCCEFLRYYYKRLSLNNRAKIKLHCFLNCTLK